MTRSTPRVFPRFPAALILVMGFVTLSGLSGYLAAEIALQQEAAARQSMSVQPPEDEHPSSTKSTVEVIPLEARPAQSSSMAVFTTRRASPVLDLIKKSSLEKNGEDLIGSSEKVFGSALSLTSDGWLVAPFAVMKDVRVADTLVVYQGRTYQLQKAMRDLSTDAVFLKINAQDLPVTAFVKATDVADGMPVWMESRAQRVSPEVILDVHVSTSSSDPVSSERATRRFLVSGATASMMGGGVWDANGRLVGLLESLSADGWVVLPASDLSSALTSLLSGGDIRHASLGIRAYDLTQIILGETRADLPRRGAWIRGDRRGVMPGIVKQGVAAKVLREGDVIERIERDILDGTADMGERLLDYPVGTQVTLSGTRQGKPFQSVVTLGVYNATEILK